MCAADASTEAMEFEITDVGSSFVRSTGGARDDISLSDTVYEGVFLKLITDNITASFVGEPMPPGNRI